MINGHPFRLSEPEKPRPCARRTWCVFDEGHAGSCFEKPPASHQKPPDPPPPKPEEKKS